MRTRRRTRRSRGMANVRSLPHHALPMTAPDSMPMTWATAPKASDVNDRRSHRQHRVPLLHLRPGSRPAETRLSTILTRAFCTHRSANRAGMDLLLSDMRYVLTEHTHTRTHTRARTRTARLTDWHGRRRPQSLTGARLSYCTDRQRQVPYGLYEGVRCARDGGLRRHLHQQEAHDIYVALGSLRRCGLGQDRSARLRDA